MYKNIEKNTKLELKDLVVYQEGQVVSKTLVQNDLVSMTVFSFDKGEEISTHAAGGDAMVTVLEGKVGLPLAVRCPTWSRGKC
ncbi:cupin domain-containing protein [Ruminococcus champanellensis]